MSTENEERIKELAEALCDMIIYLQNRGRSRAELDLLLKLERTHLPKLREIIDDKE